MRANYSLVVALQIDLSDLVIRDWLGAYIATELTKDLIKKVIDAKIGVLKYAQRHFTENEVGNPLDRELNIAPLTYVRC